MQIYILSALCMLRIVLLGVTTLVSQDCLQRGADSISQCTETAFVSPSWMTCSYCWKPESSPSYEEKC